MITNKELKLISKEYFTILQAGGFTISIQSNNTRHYWHLIVEEYPSFRHYKVYHKHKQSDEFHAHRNEPNLQTALNHIIEHDKFQMNGRK